MSNVYIGRYRVIEEIGRGGMGIVYRCDDPVLDRSVAIKVLPPRRLTQQKAVKRFLREARLCARLDHPNIIKIHDIGEEEGIYHIVMELVEGRSLRELIEARDSVAQIEIESMTRIFADVCEAIAYAHDKQIVHRDIKPDNIMLTHDGRVKVMDFGLAVLEDRKSLTEMGQVMGTVAYFSPEQARGESADARSDIYSLGAVFFEMLTNQLLFQANNPGEMIAKHLTTPPPNPRIFNPAIPPVLTNFILKCLKKNPNDRFQTAAEMLDILDKWLESGKKEEKEKTESAKAGKKQWEELEKSDIDKIASVFESGFVPKTIADDKVIVPKSEIAPKIEVEQDWQDVPAGGGFNLPNVRQDTNSKEIKTEEIQIPVFGEEVQAGEKVPVQEAKPAEAIIPEAVLEPKKPIEQAAPPAVEKPREIKITEIPPPEITAIQKKKPEIKFTAAEEPVASAKWMEDAQANEQWEKYQNVIDKIKKDEAARDKAGVGVAPVACPVCGAENEAVRKYCHECGNLISHTQFLSQKLALEHAQKGKEHLMAGRLQDALTEYQQAVARDPLYFEGFMTLGKILGDMGKYKEARAAYRDALKITPDNAQAHVMIAELYRIENRRDDAIYEYREAAKLAPADIVIRNQLALLYSQKGDIERAIDSYQRILSIDPRNLEAHRQLGYMYMAIERYEESIKEFETVLTIDPNDKRVTQILGNLYMKVGRLRNAEQVFQTVLTSNPDDPEAMSALGEIYEKQNRPDLALEKLGQAIQKDASNLEARKKLAGLYIRHNRPDLAVNELEQAIKYHPEDAGLHRSLGELYLKNKQLDKALLHFEKTVSLAPDSAEMHNTLAKLYGKKEYSELSINEYKKAISLEPYNPTYREDLGMAYYSMKRHAEAINELKKASTLDATNIDYQKALGIMYEETNQLEQAEKQFQQVIRMAPEDPLAHGMLGQVYEKQGLISMAIYQYRKALTLNPESHLFHVYLGKALAKQGKLDEAIDVFKRAIEYVPGGAAVRSTKVLGKAYIDLGKAYYEKGDYRKALDILKSALESNPNDPDTLHYLGLIYMEQKKFDVAQQFLSRAQRAEPQNPKIMRDLALAYMEKEENTIALSLAKKSIMLAPTDVEGYEVLAKVLNSMGRYTEAIQAMIDGVHACPDEADYAYWVMGTIASGRKDWNGAVKYLLRAVDLNDREWYYYKDLAVAYEETGEFDKAIKALNNAIACNPEEDFQKKIQKDLSRLQKKSKRKGE